MPVLSIGSRSRRAESTRKKVDGSLRLHRGNRAVLDPPPHGNYPMVSRLPCLRLRGNNVQAMASFVQRGRILALVSLSVDRGSAAAENVFLGLACCRLRQLRQNRKAVRHLETRHVRARELLELGFSRGRSGLEHYKCVRRFTPLLVRDSDDGGFLYGWMGE